MWGACCCSCWRAGAGSAPCPAAGPVSLSLPCGPGALPAAAPAHRQLPEGHTAASRCAWVGRTSLCLLCQAGEIGCREKLMLEQCLLSLRCPQGSTSPVPQTRGEGSGQAAYSKTHRVRAAVSVLSSSPASSQQPHTDHVPFYCCSLSFSSIIKLQVPGCWLRRKRRPGVLPALSFPRGTACPRTAFA